MPVRASLERQLLLGYLLPTVCIGVITALALSAFHATQQASVLVVQTRDVLAQVRGLQQQESRAIIAYQKALMTWDTEDQRAYVQARDHFGDSWLTLYASVHDNAAQRGRLRDWHRQFMAWDEAVVRPTLRTGGAGGVSPVPDLRLLRGDERLAAAFIQGEEALLSQRQAAARRGTHVAYWAVLLGLPLAALTLWCLGQYLLRRVQRGVGALMRATERLAAGDLSVRVPITGDDEIARLSRRFNVMADRLEAVVREQRDLQHTLEHRVDTLVRDTTHEMHLLGQLGTFMQACHEEHEAQGVLHQTAQALFPEGGTIALLAASQNLLDARMHWGPQSAPAQMFSPEDCWALRLGQPHSVSGEGRRPRCAHDPTGRVSLCLPLMAQGDTLGVVTLHFGTGEALEQTRALAQRFAERVALSLVNLRLRTTLRQQSIRDALTGLYNRRYLEESGVRELARSQRRGQPLSVLMIDVDHFKRLNDTHGHALGDAVLRRVSLHMQKFFRTEDIVCRYGGEEFVVILPECGAERARDRADALRQSVEALAVASQGSETLTVTVSVGVAAWPGPATTLADLLAHADAALYRAKHAGRNRVEFAAPRTPVA